MLPRHHRLTHPRDFAGVLRAPRGGHRARQRIGDPLLVITLAQRPPDAPHRASRVGFAVSRAVGGSVVRNRVQRRLRSLVAERMSLLASTTDMVIRALPPAATASHHDLGASLDRAFDRVARREPALLATASMTGGRR